MDLSKCIGKYVKSTDTFYEAANLMISRGTFENIIGDETLSTFKNIQDLIENENQPQEFYLLYRLWEEFERSNTLVNRSEQVAKSRDSKVVVDDEAKNPVLKKRKPNSELNISETRLSSPTDPQEMNLVDRDHSYYTPTENRYKALEREDKCWNRPSTSNDA